MFLKVSLNVVVCHFLSNKTVQSFEMNSLVDLGIFPLENRLDYMQLNFFAMVCIGLF